eukprot:COSAG04_NODE_1965_length_5118_cov_14.211994_2_plen_140_part_00
MTGLWPSGTGSRNAKAQQWVAQVSSHGRPFHDPSSMTEMTLMMSVMVLNHDKPDTMITRATMRCAAGSAVPIAVARQGVHLRRCGGALATGESRAAGRTHHCQGRDRRGEAYDGFSLLGQCLGLSLCRFVFCLIGLSFV